MDWANANEREEMALSRENYQTPQIYLQAASEDDIDTVKDVLRRVGAVHLGRELLFRPFRQMIQFAPVRPDVIRTILNAGRNASMELPFMPSMLDKYHRHPQVIHMLVNEYDLIAKCQRETTECDLYKQMLKNHGYQINCKAAGHQELSNSRRVQVAQEFVEAACNNDLETVTGIIHRYGADELRRNILLSPFNQPFQFLPERLNVIRTILNAVRDASMQMPSMGYLLEKYYFHPKIIHMLVKEYDMIGECEREGRDCTTSRQMLKNYGYTVNCRT